MRPMRWVTIRVAAELPAAFAHAPPTPLAVVQTLRFVGQPVGLAGPEMPGPVRQVKLTHPHPKVGADKPPLPAGEPCPRCSEGEFVVDFAPLAGPQIGNGAAQPDPAVRVVEGRHLESDGARVVIVVVDPEPHHAIGV